MNRPSPVPVAVVGLSAFTPGSSDVAGFWRTVTNGRDLITDVPASHWLIEDFYDPDPAAQDKTYGRRGAFLEPVDFDPMGFGVPPNTVQATDTTQLLALMVAEQVMRDCGGLSDVDRDRTSVILGAAPLELLYNMASRLQRPVWLKSLRESGVPEAKAQAICDRISDHYVPWQEASFPGMLSNVIAGRIANRFDLHGTNCTTDAACASSLAAISNAVSELALGTSDLVITGGVDTLNDILMYMCFSKTPALSPTGDCRPFSDAADGTMLGEGLVMFALKRLEDAEREGDRVYAVIRGIGTASDGKSTAIYAPLPAGQSRALRRAYENAGYGPDTVELVEAHGTGTTAGDAAEFAALRSVFAESGREDTQWCALGSVKSQIGHTKAAAGAAGMLKAVLSLHHKVLPPTIKVDRPNPKLELDTSPLYLNTEARPWIRADSHPRRASVSSFGFGGSNFHLALEEYTGDQRAWRSRTAPTELVLLSAPSPAELLARAKDLDSRSLTAIARKSQQDFRPTDHSRLAIVATDFQDLADKLDQMVALIEKDPATPISTPNGMHYAAGHTDTGEVAFLFPGQGSQYVGMGGDIAMQFGQAGGVWDRAAGMGLHHTVFPVPVFSDAERAEQEQWLTATECAQPALALTSLALLEVVQGLGISASHVAGHSFGELVALHHAGSLDEDGLLQLARRRGELMRDAAEVPGVMLAVTASRAEVDEALRDCTDWWVANHNSPKQVVISGTVEAIAATEQALAGFQTTRLNAATAFHSPLVAPASEPLLEFLHSLPVEAPRISVYSNASADIYPASPDEIRARVASHLTSPVRFVEEIEAMYARGVRTFIEVGAGAAISRLAGQILGERPHVAVSLDRKGRHGVTTLHEALGKLAVAGLAMDFEALWADYAPEPLNDEKPRMTMAINGANHDRPYPPLGGAAELPPPNPEVVEAPPAPAPAPVAADSGWLAAYQDMQRQTADVHAAFQRAMTDSHLSFLKATESSLNSLAVSLGGDVPLPAYTPAPISMPVPVPMPMPALVPAAPAALAAPPSSPAPPPIPRPAPATPSQTADLQGILLSVVSDKTGYPVDMLNSTMELESDLGIDSIKRVEILSTLRERVPTLPEVNMTELGKLRTLGEIATVLNPGIKPAESPNLQAVLLAVVADKTGYPVDMLSSDMELETDLGIDSIKRVEILSTLREKVPGLPEVHVAELGKLRTLGEIVSALDSAAPGVPSASEPEAPLSRQVVRMVPAAASGLAMAGLGDGPLVVTDEGTGVAAEVVAQLGALGIEAEVVSEVPEDAHGVIFLGGLREDGDESVNHEAFRAARAVAGHAKFFVTVQDTGGDFGLSGSAPERVWLGGIAGLTRSAAREWPDASVKAIDCARGDRDARAVAESIVRELVTGASTLEVGLSADGGRATVITVEEPAGAPAAQITTDSVIVATGGARGVTAAALIALAGARQPRLALIGRTPLTPEDPALQGITDEAALKRAIVEQDRTRTPAQINSLAAKVLAGREITATLEAIERAGSKVRYLSVDVTDERELARALEDVRCDWGPITGIVHAAGVLADKRIADKTDDQYRYVVGTKIAGLRALLAATSGDPITHLCMFSSVAARYGNIGQSDYAIGNEVLNQVASAEQAKDPAKVVRSIAWGAWQGGMVTPALAQHFHSVGVRMIPLAAGAAAFVDEFTSRSGDVQVVIVPEGTDSLDGAGSQPRNALIRISERSHPYLADHDIAGMPVVPVAMALEWFAAAAQEWAPTTDSVVLRDITVLRKIGLDHFTNSGNRLVVQGQHSNGHGLALQLLGEGELPHYRASVTTGGTIPKTSWVVPSDLEMMDSEVYDGELLFHGPRFQAIRELHGVSNAGASAVVTGACQLDWHGEVWQTDPAAVDACLQLALLWGRHVFGGSSLPMGVREYRMHRPGLIDGPLRCVLRGGHVHDGRAECDVALIDEDGSARVELFGVSIVRRPQ